ncbi:DUF2852 domain-containing protein [Palleronia sediminis]|uniref:DUF2852 domain-containing protein n=1 Tax=Palleronia sediminis TaxID=2547833 RepID=A0A4R6ARB9_9RHOB|nr:DUF2852 domain-containing protein [Palleronia sediminis]TDL84283.1 DUF2852 domain-containing protein [Palleronia sediminis]
MSTLADFPATRGNWITRTEGWLDARGKGAWIALMIAGFIFVWPVGLAVLGYMLYAGKFQLSRSGAGCGMRRSAVNLRASSGNAAFDAYRAETLRRLEDEQAAFEAFLGRLREAKDKAEFDQFMDDRKRRDDRAEPTVQDA